jgi:trigger factor
MGQTSIRILCYSRFPEVCDRHVKVTLERLPESRVQLDIEVDPDRLEKSVEAAYKRIASKARIEGFRPGKAPRHLIMQRVGGRPALIREALDDLVPDVYNEAIASEDVDAIDQPELEIVELDPVRFKATVPVRPTVNLNDYRSLRVDPEPVEVTPEQVNEQILGLRRRHATHAPVERGAQWNDILTGSVNGKVGDEAFVKDEDAEFTLREGATLLIPGLAEAFLGMKKGDTKTLDLPVPDDFRSERFQGKTASFTLTIDEVKEEQLPEEDDDFAQAVNADEFPSFESLRQRIEDDLRKSLETQEKNRFQGQAVDRLVELATLEYPKVLIDREIDHIVRESLGNDVAGYQRYLAQIGRSEAEFKETFREPAELRVRRSLVLNALAEAEGLDVSADEIEEEVATLAEPMGDEAARFRDLFATTEGVATIRRNLLSKKTIERLEALAAGEAPVQDAAELKEGSE